MTALRTVEMMKCAGMPLVEVTANGYSITGVAGDWALTDFANMHPVALNTRRRVWQTAARGGRAVEIGAHIGCATIPLAKVFREVHAYEPSRVNFDLLHHNVVRNGANNITCERLAFDKAVGSGRMYLCPQSVCNSLSPNVAHHVGDEPVEVTTLDERLQRDDCTMLLIDAEGYDMRVLQGACRWLRRQTQFPLIQIEYAPRIWAACGMGSAELLEFCTMFDLRAFADMGNNWSPLSPALLSEVYSCWKVSCYGWLDVYLVRRGAFGEIFPQ